MGQSSLISVEFYISFDSDSFDLDRSEQCDMYMGVGVIRVLNGGF